MSAFPNFPKKTERLAEGWSISYTSEPGAPAVVVREAPVAGMRAYVSYVSASFRPGTVGDATLVVTDADAEIFRYDLGDDTPLFDVTLDRPIPCGGNGAIVARLGAVGPGVVGVVSVEGFDLVDVHYLERLYSLPSFTSPPKEDA